MAINGRKIREQVLALLARKDYRPLDKTDIARKLGLTASERVALRKTLRELERAGQIARIPRDTPHDRIKGRREGRVIRILERAHDTIVGTLQRSRNFYYVVPDDPRFVHDIYVHPERDQRPGTSANVGDKVVVRLDAWESRHVNPEGEIIEVLGPASAPGIDMLSIIRKYHLP